MEHRARNILVALVIACVTHSDALAQLRVVSWNTAGGPREGIGDILEAIGNESVNGIAKPIDVLSLQEQSSSATTTQAIVDVLNGIYGDGTYDRATIDGDTNGAGRPGLIYNTNTVSLLVESAMGTVSTSAQARQTLWYGLRPTGSVNVNPFYVFSNHYKAGTGSSNEARRLVEAAAIRDFTDLGLADANVIYTGDFNIQSSDDAMYVELTRPGAGQAFDPINAPGDWHDSSFFKAAHTQAPSSTPSSGLVTGGVDDRFDFQLVSDELVDGEGYSYIPGSYHVFGNNGTHNLNGSISTGNGASPDILSKLESASDHLPVVADYQVPAIFESTNLASGPISVEQGSFAEITYVIENAADVVSPLGADELDYQLEGFEGVMGSFVGSDLALGGGNAHTFTLDTSTLGIRNGYIDVTNNSQDNFGDVIILVNYRVLPEFSADFNNDGDVDGGDFLTWQRGFGIGPPFFAGDANHDTHVDAADLAIWETQYGQGSLGLSSTVPEPSSACLLLAGIVAALWRRKD